QTRNEVHDSRTQQWFASRNANFADAQPRQNPAEPQELIPAQQFTVRKIVLRIGGLAVNATEVAPVRHRNAKVVDVTPELVFQHYQCKPAPDSVAPPFRAARAGPADAGPALLRHPRLRDYC